MGAGQKIAVIGGGLMGAGIAQIFALAGHSVAVFEPDEASRESLQSRIAETLQTLSQDVSATSRVTGHAGLEGAVEGAEFVFEAAPEKLALKQAIFVDLDHLLPEMVILASNTSVLPITEIAAKAERRGRIVGTHFWNPPYLVPLVEVVQAADSDIKAVERTISLLTSVGKKAVHIKKDVPGFVGNRLQHALWREAIAIVADGICDAETVDDVVKNSFGLRLPVLGPLENADLVGLDLTLDIHNTILSAINSFPGPSPYLEKLVQKGDLGFKSGKGFRAWNAEQIKGIREKLLLHLKKGL